jgi:hypothetical protein
MPSRGWLDVWKDYLERCYKLLVHKPWFARVLVGVFLLDAVVSLGSVGLALAAPLLQHHFHLSVSTTASASVLVASAIVAGCVIVGGTVIRQSRVDAYEWFRRALLVDILLKQPFLFYHQQFRAVFGLAIYLVGLATLNYMISRERAEQKVS